MHPCLASVHPVGLACISFLMHTAPLRLCLQNVHCLRVSLCIEFFVGLHASDAFARSHCGEGIDRGSPLLLLQGARPIPGFWRRFAAMGTRDLNQLLPASYLIPEYILTPRCHPRRFPPRKSAALSPPWPITGRGQGPHPSCASHSSVLGQQQCWVGYDR